MAKTKQPDPPAASAPEHRPRRTRSPNYPALDLATAIKRVAELHQKEGRHAVPYTVAAGHWKYKPDSSSAIQTVAAIKAFGLVEIEGSGDDRELTISARGLDIVLDEREDSESREAAIKVAALAPTIHRELWQKYGASLPSDATIRTYLQRERGFNQTALDPFITEYKGTISFAKLGEGDTIPEPEEEESPPDDGGKKHHRASAAPLPPPPKFTRSPMPTGSKQDTFTLDEGQAVLQWPGKLSKSSYQDFEDWLKLQLRRIKRSTTDTGQESGDDPKDE